MWPTVLRCGRRPIRHRHRRQVRARQRARRCHALPDHVASLGGESAVLEATSASTGLAAAAGSEVGRQGVGEAEKSVGKAGWPAAWCRPYLHVAAQGFDRAGTDLKNFWVKTAAEGIPASCIGRTVRNLAP